MMVTSAFIGFSECLFIFIVAFIVLGPEKMPELARKLGRTIREFKKGYADFQSTVQDDIDQVKKSVGIEDFQDIQLEYEKIKTMSHHPMADVYRNTQTESQEQDSKLRSSSERKDDEK